MQIDWLIDRLEISRDGNRRIQAVDGINSFSKLERKKGSAPAWNWLGCPSSTRLPFIGHVLIDACLSDRRTVGGPNATESLLEPNDASPCHSSNEKGASERERERKVFKKRSETRARAKGKAHPRSFYTDRPSAAGEDDHLCARVRSGDQSSN